MFALIVLLTTQMNAQKVEILTFDKAVTIALENNYDIQIAKKDLEIASNNYSPGQAGLHPSLTLNGGLGYGVNDAKNQPSGSPARVVTSAQSTTYNGALNIDYVLFQGWVNQNTYRRLGELKQMTHFQVKVDIESTILNLANAFYNLAQTNEQVEVSKENLKVSEEQLERAEVALELGTTNSLPYFNLLVNRNEDSISYLNLLNSQRELYQSLINTLNYGMEDSLVIADQVQMNPEITYDFIKERFESQNSQLNLERQRVRLQETELQINNGNLYPRISLNGGYSYNRSQDDASFLIFRRTNGLNLNLTATYNLYNGGRTKKAEQNAKIALEQSELSFKSVEQQLLTDLKTSYLRFENSKKTWLLNERNIEAVHINFERTKERYELGQMTSTQFREAQLNLLRARSSLTNSKYEYKLAELDLRRLSGGLID